MTLDIWFFAIAIPAVLFAGISKGGFGSGAAFAATPLLALILEPAAAVGLMLPLLMLMDIGALKPYWRLWSWSHARLLILGAVPGIALGTIFFSVANPDHLKLLIGLVAIGFVFWQVVGKRRYDSKRALGVWAGLIAGLVTGFTSFISHAGGPPAAVYLLSHRLSKTSYQATTVLIFWVVNIGKFVPYAALGIFSRATFTADLYLAPFALIGVWLGVQFHRAMSERAFFGFTYVFLTITGGKLIWDALV